MADGAGPKPSGWQQLDNDKIEEFAGELGDMAALIMRNPNLTAADFTTNLVVTEVPSQGDFQSIIDNELAQLTAGTGVTTPAGEKGRVCDFDSYTITYDAPAIPGRAPARQITSRMIVVPKTGDTSTTVVLTAQSADPGDSTYLADMKKMFDGVQVSTGAAGD